MKNKLSNIHERFIDLDAGEIVKKNDSAGLSEVENEVLKIYEWEKQYQKDRNYRQQLPAATRESIEQEFENASNQFRRIVNLRTENIAVFANEKKTFVQTIRNYYAALYDLFVRDYRGWKLDQTQRVQALKSIFAEAEAVQAQIREKSEEVVKQADATAVATGDIGLSELAKFFNQLVGSDREHPPERKFWRHRIVPYFQGYQGAARIWLFWAILAFGTAFFVADNQILPFLEDLTQTTKNKSALINSGPAVVYAILIAKALVLAVPLYAIRFCLKNYGSNKHLAADALQKAKTLQTLPAYLAIARDDQATAREIATIVAQLVFAPTESGFISKKNDYDGPDININTPIKG